MIFDIVELLYYLIPAAALIFFAVSLIVYILAKKETLVFPGHIQSRR